jgi:hypothetical protein
MSASESSRPGRRPNPALHELWQQRLLRFERSGSSVAGFCAEQGVSLPSFYAWRRRLRADASASAPASVSDDPPFVPIRLLQSATPVELVLPSGAVLRLAPGCDLAFVRSLIASLGGASC